MEQPTGEPTRRCGVCGIRRPLSEFYVAYEERTAARGRRRTQSCRPCMRERMLARVAVQTEYMQRVKLESGCVDCGLKIPHPEVYDFDHRPGEVKVGDVSKLRVGALATLVAEIAKCDVVCANCHRIRTVARRDHLKGYGLDRLPQPVIEPPDDPQLVIDWPA